MGGVKKGYKFEKIETICAYHRNGMTAKSINLELRKIAPKMKLLPNSQETARYLRRVDWVEKVQPHTESNQSGVMEYIYTGKITKSEALNTIERYMDIVESDRRNLDKSSESSSNL